MQGKLQKYSNVTCLTLQNQVILQHLIHTTTDSSSCCLFFSAAGAVLFRITANAGKETRKKLNQTRIASLSPCARSQALRWPTRGLTKYSAVNCLF